MSTINERYEAEYPIGDLIEHPANPRKGDIAALKASLDEHEFYGAIVVQESTKRILAGNHRWKAAQAVGYETVPVLFVDVDDEQARRILLVDNRVNDLATYDNDALLALLRELDASDHGLTGTGYNADDLALLASLDDDGGLDGDGRPQLGDMTYRIVVECDDEEHQAELLEAFTSEGLSVRAVIN